MNKKLASSLKVNLFKNHKSLNFIHFIKIKLLSSQHLLTQINTPYASKATNSTTKIKYKKGKHKRESISIFDKCRYS